MKNIYGADFGVRFYRRGQKKKAVQKQTVIVERMSVRTFKPSELKMIFDNRAQDFRKPKIFGSFDLSKIIRKRTNVSAATSAKERALWVASQKGDCRAIRLLVMAGVDLDARDGAGRSALNIATQYNQKDAIKTLLAAREMMRMAKLDELPSSVFYDKFKKKQTNGS